VSHPREELTALLDGALPPARRDELERHLAGCAACRAERDGLRAGIAALAAVPPPPGPSPSFGARLEARLARAAPPGLLGRLSAWRWRLAAPAIGLAASAAIAVVAVRQHRRDVEAMAAHLDLLEDYEVVVSVGDVSTAEDAQIVASLDELAPRGGRP